MNLEGWKARREELKQRLADKAVRGQQRRNLLAAMGQAEERIYSLTPRDYEAERERERREDEAARQRHERVKVQRACAFKNLRRWGFRREHASEASAYYLRDSDGARVRVSDHEVPETPEREYNAANGGFSWATRGLQIRVDAAPYEFARNLVAVRRRVAQ